MPTDPDADFDEAARALESRDELEGTFELGGEEYPLRVTEPTLDELEEIEEEVGDGADETDVIREIADQYLLEPDVNVGGIGVSKLYALFEGMNDTWLGSDGFDAAAAEMPLDQGNPPTSRN